MSGGEDTVVEQELKLLKQYHTVEVVYFQNYSGWKGAIQFLASIWNIYSVKKVREKIIEFKPDLVHIHNWHFALGPLVFREINNLDIPIVHTIHNYRLLCPSGILLNNGLLFTHSLHQKFPYHTVQKTFLMLLMNNNIDVHDISCHIASLAVHFPSNAFQR